MDNQEIIRAVAEKVLGWHIENHHSEKDVDWDGWYDSQGNFRFWVHPNYDNELLIPDLPFNPLTNANHWMMVVERLREDGWKFRLDSEDPREYSANFYKEIPSGLGYGYEEWNFDGVGKPGHAICLAALKAVEEK